MIVTGSNLTQVNGGLTRSGIFQPRSVLHRLFSFPSESNTVVHELQIKM
jgi:hypothetical protein